MKRPRRMLLLAVLAFSAAVPPIMADDALARARQDLQEAISQYEQLTADVSAAEEKLIREVELLDDRVLELSRELRTLEGEEALANKKRQQLENELERREVEFDYFWKTFDQYRSQLVNRLHVAESQTYEATLGELKIRVDGAGDDLVAKVEANAPALQLGVDRLLDLAGGHSFEGKAAGLGNTLETGSFAVFGPLGFFAGDNGEVAGMTAFTAGDVNIPAILQMNDADKKKVVSFVREGSGVVPIDPSLGKAFQIEDSKKSIGEFLDAGGYVGYAIVVFGIIGGALVVFKLIEILRFKVPSRSAVNEILDDLLDGNEEEAIERSEGLEGLAGRVVEAGTRHFFAKRRILEDALFEKMSAVQPRLDRLLPFLAVIAAAAPMAGLLGTVLGIMKTFDMMAQFGTGDAKVTAGGIGEALITTFLGLMVAIPTIIVHGLLKSLARTRLGQVEGIALAMVNGTTEIGKESPGVQKSNVGEESSEDEDEGLEDVLVEPA